MKPFAVGDKVAYSVQFCRSLGLFAGDIPNARGVIEKLEPLGERTLAHVRWGDAEVTRVITQNLAHVGPNLRFCAC